ncbi:GroES-like protein [Pholiota conissans]|uniref:GroES-like protein n=1 Tax=Pholiota conissans TaxID=109636 RepID=A0A9P5ZCD0_9AGAR|nr:GroES-like protein [Pholiota conissans]
MITAPSVPTTEKALLLPQKQAESLVIADVQVSKPQSGEILIKVHSISLNPVDWKIHKWGIFFEDFPAILGNDMAGEVVELGKGVTDFAIGDRVFGQAPFRPDRGTFQQYVVALASTTAKIPENITYDQAATIPTVLTAAYVGLYNHIPYGLGIFSPLNNPPQRYPDTPILIFGGASSVGQSVLQLAHLSGFSPIITTASMKHTEWLKSLGATAILDRNLDVVALSAEIKKFCNGKPLKYIYDAISSPETQKAGFDILDDGGRIVNVTPPVVTPPVIESTNSKTVVHVSGVLRYESNIPLLEPLYHDHLFGLVEKGLIKSSKVEVLPHGLAGISAGLDRLEADSVSGLKLIAHPQDTTA